MKMHSAFAGDEAGTLRFLAQVAGFMGHLEFTATTSPPLQFSKSATIRKLVTEAIRTALAGAHPTPRLPAGHSPSTRC
jgi:hypothetical protein